MTHDTDARGTSGATTEPDIDRILHDGLVASKRLSDRIVAAFQDGDEETVRWLHKRILAVERAAQERESR